MKSKIIILISISIFEACSRKISVPNMLEKYNGDQFNSLSKLRLFGIDEIWKKEVAKVRSIDIQINM